MITTSNWGSTNFRTESTLRLFLTFVQVYLYSSIYGSSVLNLNVKDILTNVRACIFYNCTERLKSVRANITRKKLIKNLLIFIKHRFIICRQHQRRLTAIKRIFIHSRWRCGVPWFSYGKETQDTWFSGIFTYWWHSAIIQCN